MPNNNPQINPSEVKWDEQVDPSGIVWDGDKKKVSTSSNGSPELLQQSKPDGAPFKSPIDQQNNLYNTDKVGYVDSVLNAHKDLDWVQRLYLKDTPDIPTPPDMPDYHAGDRSTHLMGDNGKGYVFPTVVRINGKLQYLHSNDAENYARKTNTGIQFPTTEQGSWFAANGYKQGTNVLKNTGEGNPLSQQQNNFKSPIEILNESGGNGSLVPKIKESVYDNVPDNAPLTLPNQQELKGLVKEYKKNDFVTPEHFPKDSEASKFLSGIYSALDVAPNPYGELGKLADKAFVGSATMALSGAEQIPKAAEDIKFNQSDPAAIFEVPAAMTKMAFGAAGTILPSLMAFNTAIQGVEEIVPEQYVGAIMSPMSTMLENKVFVVPSIGGSSLQIIPIKDVSKGVHAMGEIMDLAYQFLMFKGFGETAAKLKSGKPFNATDRDNTAVAMDEATKNQQSFDPATLEKIPQDAQVETKVKVAPLIEEKQNAETEIRNLQSEKSKLDKNFHPEKDEEIIAQEKIIEEADKKIKSITEQKKQDTRTEEQRLPLSNQSIIDNTINQPDNVPATQPAPENRPLDSSNTGEQINIGNDKGSGGENLTQEKTQEEKAALIERNKGLVENIAGVSGGVGKLGEMNSILNQETDLKGGEKEAWMVRAPMRESMIPIQQQQSFDAQKLPTRYAKAEDIYGVPFYEMFFNKPENLSGSSKAIYEDLKNGGKIELIPTAHVVRGLRKGTNDSGMEINIMDGQNRVKAMLALGMEKIPYKELTHEFLDNFEYKKGFTFKNEIKKALDENKYQKAISEGRITPQDAVTIIKSARLEVPKEILDQSKSETPLTVENKPQSILGSDTKVVDENNNPKIVYHGTNAADVTSLDNFHFENDEVIKNKLKEQSPNFHYYFTDSKPEAQSFGKNVLEVYLDIRNPSTKKSDLLKTKSQLQKEGYDGFIGKMDDGRTHYVVFDKSQIKEVPKDIADKAGGGEVKNTPLETKIDQLNTNKSKVQTAREKAAESIRLASENRKANDQNLGIVKNSLDQVKKQAELDRKAFDDILDYAREFINEKLGDLNDFLKNIPENVHDIANKAWGVAKGDSKYEDTVKEVESLSAGAETKVSNPDETGIKNEVTLAERQAKGLDEVEVEARRSFGDAFEAGKKAVDSGKIDPRVLAKNLAKKPRPLSAEESVALIYDRMRLQNEHRQVMDLFEEATKKEDEAGRTENAIRLAGIEDAMLANDEAARKTGYEQGLGLAARRMMIKQDYSLSNILQRARVANDGKPIPDDVRAKIESLSKERDKLLDQLEQHKTKIADLQKQLATKPERQSVKRQAKKLADKVRGLKTKPLILKDEHGNPIIVKESNFYNEAIELVAKSIELGGDLAEAIQKGMDHIRSQKFFGELSDGDKAAVEKQFTDHVSKQLEGDEAKKLETYKKQLRKKLADIGAKIINKGAEKKKTNLPVKVDEEARNLQAQVNKKQNQLEIEVQKLNLANRSKVEKGLDFLAKWRRGVLLTSVTTLGKLTSAATQRIITTPIEEIEGALISKIPGISKIAAKAPREGSFSARGEALALAQLFKKATYKDVWETAKTGRSQLDYLYGKQNVLPPTLLDFFGQLHGALKVTPKRAEFFRAFAKRSEFAIKNGVDASDPAIQAVITGKAYIDANRSILMHDNAWTDAYKTAINYLQAKGTGGKVASTFAKLIFPIVKIPVNYVGEATSYAGGGLKALAQVIIAGGVDKLTPDQADYVMRNLKKQGIGAVVLAIGYLNADNIGGYYQQGEKRSEKDAQAGGMKLFGKNIPRYLLHSPLMEMLQFGATIKRVQDSYSQKGKDGGTAEGIFQSGKGLMFEVPFFDEPSRISEAAQNTHGVVGFGADLASSMVIPPDVTKYAVSQDVDENGNPISRKPEGFVEHVKTKIPILREQVPINESKEWGQKQQSILEQFDKKPIATDFEIKKQLFGKTDLNKSEEDSFDLFKKKAKTVSEFGIDSRELNLTKSLSGIISNKKKAEILKHYQSEKGNKFDAYKTFALNNKIISPAVIAIMEGRNPQSDSEQEQPESAPQE